MANHPYEWRTNLRRRLPWFLIRLGVAAKGADCETVGAQHHWYNVDGEQSGCYHCLVVRTGRFWESTDDARRHLATLLESVAEGTLGIEEAFIQLKKLDAPWGEDDFLDAFHFMKHFESDADIRFRDKEYAESQVAALRLIAQRLRDNSPSHGDRQ